MGETYGFREALLRELFEHGPGHVDAILDGASCPGLIDALSEHKPEACCLYRGPLNSRLAAAAPYLVRVREGDPMASWILERWGGHAGVFCAADVPMATMRKHLRGFLRVRSYDGRILVFRWYDPRVLRVYLPTCNPREMMTVFGPIQWWACEDEEIGTLLRFRIGKEGPLRQAVDLTGGGVVAVPKARPRIARA